MKHLATRLLFLSAAFTMACSLIVDTNTTPTDAATDAMRDAAVTDTPIVTDVPVVTDIPIVTDVPILTDTPFVADSPIVTDVPIVTDGGRVPMLHRANNAACLAPDPAGNCMITGGPPTICMSDSQCTAGTNGRCVFSGGGILSCNCSYDTCTTDSECTMGGPCACHTSAYVNGGNTCVPGNCHVDSDCGTNGYCSPAIAAEGCGSLGGYYCHTASDTCIDDGDCMGGPDGPQICTYNSTVGHWVCAPQLLCG